MKRILLTITGALIFASAGIAKEIPYLPKPKQSQNSSTNTKAGTVLKTVEELCQPSKSQSDLSINNVRATILGGGDMWWDLNVARYEVPKGSNRHSMFAGALWLGGIDEGNQLKLAAMTYRQGGNDYWPGPLSTDGNASVTKEICDKYDRHWIIYREEVELHKAWLECRDDPNCNDGEIFPGYESTIPASIVEWPGNGVEGELPYALAPFIDRDQDGVYDPLYDYPAYDIDKEFDCRLKETDVIYGDQTLWWVYNDRGNVHSESQASALGFEIRAQTFAFSTNDEVNNMTFNNYRILNKSTFRLTNTFFSTWFDPDLGNHLDDIIGCDIARGLGYVYNADADDEGPRGYGLNPPAIGFDFFQGPFADYFDGLDNDRDGCVDAVRNDEGVCIPENPATGINERIIMSQFMYYNNTSNAVSGNPANGTEFYNYMRARWRNGFPLVIDNPSGPGNSGNGDGYRPDGSGTPTRFAYPGVTFDTTGAYPPNSSINWFESPDNQEDKRGLHSAGPFSLAPGALNFITVGVVWERDLINNDLFASQEKVVIADDKAQRLFDNCFQVLNGPDAPDLTIQEMKNQLILNLSYRPSSNNYKFQYREKDPLITVAPGTDIDSLLQVNPFYFDYTYEGFQIFQLKHKDVSISDVYDPTQARLVAQCDVQNGYTQLINWEVDPNLNQLVPQDMTLETNNDGVFMSFRFTEDAFATENRALINNREYYYTVLAYGVNQYEVFHPTTAPAGQRKPFLAGRRNINTYVGIPHINDAENGGTRINAEYGDGPEITRIEGLGNGAISLELKEEVIDGILNSPEHSSDSVTYVGGAGPVNIRVVDPLAVPKGNYILAFTTSDDKSKWSIETANGEVVAISDTTLEFFNEQIIPELGLSVTLVQPESPGGDLEGDRDNGVLGSEIVYADPSKAWWQGIADANTYDPTNWLLAGSEEAQDAPGSYYVSFEGDPKEYFSEIIDGTWGPAAFASGLPRTLGPSGNVDIFGMGPYPDGVVRPTSMIEETHSVDVVLTTDPTKWTRVPVFEMSEDDGLSEGGMAKHGLRADTSYSLSGGTLVHDLSIDQGWSYFPGYAIDVETGDRLNMAFAENSWLRADRGDDMKWNPTDRIAIAPGDIITGGYVLGGQHFIYVFAPYRKQGLGVIDNRYKGDDITQHPMYSDLKLLPANGLAKNKFWGTGMWVAAPLLRPGFDFDPYTELPTETKFKMRMTTQYSNWKSDPSPNEGHPMFGFSTDNVAVQTMNLEVAKSALDLIKVVPNPYYGWSRYETSQLDNIVRITNLPQRCVISIFTSNGTLVRQINKDNSDTWVPWDLKNQYNVPISSGVFIIHIDAGEAGEKVVKWFGALRPVDLNAF